MAKSKTAVIVVVVAALALVAAGGYFTRDKWMGALPFMQRGEDAFKIVEKDGARFKECYTCPMHPQVLKPSPGDCPICGMTLVKKLVPVEGQRPGPAPAPEGAAHMQGTKTAEGFNIIEEAGRKYKECFICPMHPEVIEPEELDCPVCGMVLERNLMPFETGGGGEGAMPGMDMEKEMAAPMTGEQAELMRVSLDPRERMLANVATSEVRYRDLSQDVYTVGRINYDEQTLRRVTAWFPGRVERLYVDFTGREVRKGERIMSVYSPELISTQKEYLIAKAAMQRLESSGFPEITKGTADVLEAARTRMKLWGLTDVQVDELDETGVVKNTADVYSPFSGTVVEMMVREGSYVDEGSELYRIADLSKVWMQAEVYEYEFSKVSLGSHVEVTAEAYPGRTFEGRVTFIDPFVDNESRTVKVRAELPNKGGMLKPDMFVNALVHSKTRRVLTVPASAVLYTGKRNVAWVEVEPGVFEHRGLKLGMRSGDEFEVLAGLDDGDMVVTQGGFLIDSEAELMMGAGGGHAMHGMDMGDMDAAGKTKPEDEKMPAGHVH